MRKLKAHSDKPITTCLVLFVLLWPALLQAQTRSPQSRPLTSYERFVLESEMLNQLQSKLDKYLDPASYQLKLSLEGRMLADAEGQTERPNKPVASPQEELISMLPALPFFDAKRRTELPSEASLSPEPKSVPNGIMLRGGPEITRLRIALVTDTSIHESDANFYAALVQELIGFNARRGDEFTWNQVVFPAIRTITRAGESALSTAPIGFAGEDPLRISVEGGALLAQIQRMADALKYESFILLAGLAIVLIVLVVFFSRRLKPESTVQGNGNRNGATNRNELQNTANSEHLVVQELNLQGRKTEEEEIKQEDKLLKWLLHHQRHLVLMVEKFASEQGPTFLQKLAILLQQYRREYAELLCSSLSDVNRFELEAALKKPLTSAVSIQDGLTLITMLDEAFKAHQRHGFFPFVMFLTDEELAELLRPELPISCLMVFDGMPADRQTRIMKLLDPKKVADMISQFDELPAIRYSRYELLGVTLFERLTDQRTMQRFVDDNLPAVIQTLKSQSLDRQALVLKDLKIKNRRLFQEVRKELLLWSDLEQFTEDDLRQAIEIFDGSQLLELLKGDEQAQQLLLPLRPAREQLMLKESLERNAEPTEETDALRKRLLETLYPFSTTRAKSNTPKSRLMVKN